MAVPTPNIAPHEVVGETHAHKLHDFKPVDSFAGIKRDIDKRNPQETWGTSWTYCNNELFSETNIGSVQIGGAYHGYGLYNAVDPKDSEIVKTR